MLLVARQVDPHSRLVVSNHGQVKDRKIEGIRAFVEIMESLFTCQVETMSAILDVFATGARTAKFLAAFGYLD